MLNGKKNGKMLKMLFIYLKLPNVSKVSLLWRCVGEVVKEVSIE